MDIIIIIIVIIVICICCYICINQNFKNINGGSDYDDMMKEVNDEFDKIKEKYNDFKEKYEYLNKRFDNQYKTIQLNIEDIESKGKPGKELSDYNKRKAQYAKTTFKESVKEFNRIYDKYV